MDAGGAAQRRLTNPQEDESPPAWSTGEIYVMNTDGTGQKRLTDIPGNDHWPPTWSPDSTRIAFTSDGPQGSDIYAMNADGSGLTNVTGDPANAAFPAWQPQETVRNRAEEIVE